MVVDDWKARQRQELAQKSAEEMDAELKAGGEFAKLAADKGLEVVTTEPITRNGNSQLLPRDLVGKLFEAKLGETVSGPGNDGFVIALLKGTETANPAADAEQVKKLGDELNSAMRGDLMNQLANGLRQNYPVSINAEAINAQF